MLPILIGALIEAGGFIFFVIGSAKEGMPPGPAWLVPAIAMVVIGNGMVVFTVLSRIMASRKKPRDQEKV